MMLVHSKDLWNGRVTCCTSYLLLQVNTQFNTFKLNCSLFACCHKPLGFFFLSKMKVVITLIIYPLLKKLL